MWLTVYELEWFAKVREREMLREAERQRLICEARCVRDSRGVRAWVEKVLRNVRGFLAGSCERLAVDKRVRNAYNGGCKRNH